jgi:hypothetical protein
MKGEAVVSPHRVGLALASLLSASACTSSTTPTVVPSPAVAAAPQGSGCGLAIARTQTVVESDVATGNLAKPVGDRFGADLARAAGACSAGREREALGLLAAAKARYGYP